MPPDSATSRPALPCAPRPCSLTGDPLKTLQLASELLPTALEWGQVLVAMALVPVSPADLYSSRLGGVYGSESVACPFVGGHDGVGIVRKVRWGSRRCTSKAAERCWVADRIPIVRPPPDLQPSLLLSLFLCGQVGPGVKQLAEGDVVLPLHAFAGTWRSLAVHKEKDLLRVGCMPAGGSAAAHLSAPAPVAAAGSAAAAALLRAAGADGRGGQQPGGLPAPAEHAQQPLRILQPAVVAATAAPATATVADALPLPLEYLAVSRELITAYRLLEQERLKVRG